MVTAYVLYSIVMAGLAWRSRAPLGRARLIHSADLLAVSGLLAAVDRPTYLVLPLLVYAFLSGSLRWQWRGTQWTGALLLVVTVVMVSTAPSWDLCSSSSRASSSAAWRWWQ